MPAQAVQRSRLFEPSAQPERFPAVRCAVAQDDLTSTRTKRGHFFGDNGRFLGVSRVLEKGPRYGPPPPRVGGEGIDPA